MKNIFAFVLLFAAAAATAQDAGDRFRRRGDGGTIRILEAIYGQNVGTNYDVADHVADQCDGLRRCRYRVDHNVIGDPARGRHKNFVVTFKCGRFGEEQTKRLPGEASGRTIEISCDRDDDDTGPIGGMEVKIATYGENVGANRGNSTHYVAQECNGRWECEYYVDHNVIGDPAPGHSKNFVVYYTCPNTDTLQIAEAGPEASGHSVKLTCGGSWR